jgi:hypothetical protein
MGRWLALAAHLLVFATSILARSSSGNSVLVVLGDDQKKDDFSQFFGDLEGMFLQSNTQRIWY